MATNNPPKAAPLPADSNTPQENNTPAYSTLGAGSKTADSDGLDAVLDVAAYNWKNSPDEIFDKGIKANAKAALQQLIAEERIKEARAPMYRYGVRYGMPKELASAMIKYCNLRVSDLEQQLKDAADGRGE